MLIVFVLSPVSVVELAVPSFVLILVPTLLPEVFLCTFLRVRRHVVLQLLKPAVGLLVVGVVVVLVDLVEMSRIQSPAFEQRTCHRGPGQRWLRRRPLLRRL